MRKRKKLQNPFDRYNLLGEVDIEKPTIDDILNDDDFGLLDTEKDLSIFKYKNIPKPDDRAESDYVAQRKPVKQKEFQPYELMFQKVQQEIKEGKRKIIEFNRLENNLQAGKFYLLDGLILYLETADVAEKLRGNNTGNRVQVDGRTITIFENGTMSNMLFRSLGKALQKSGKLITDTYENLENELFVNANILNEEDIQTGWIYILKSKSTNPLIASISNLYKIGFSSTPINERIKNAANEATYLFADVTKVSSYACYNRNADKLEQLLHRFFASACLDIDLFNEKGQRLNPREWFVVPFEIIEEAIELILNEDIINYKYDSDAKLIIRT